MKIGVLGAAGRLGQIIVETLDGAGAAPVALASRQSGDWPDGTVHRRYAPADGEKRLRLVGGDLDAVILAAPAPPADCLALLESGCHLVDVGIEADRIAAIHALAPQAERAGRSIVTMAGLAPGLTGMVGRAILEEADADARATVCLVQCARGTAGRQGTRDMLDLLTRHGSPARTAVVGHDATGVPERLPVHSLPTPETAIWPADPAIAFVTTFDDARLNGAMRAMAALRRVAPPAYRFVRDRVADAKATARPAKEETVALRGLAFAGSGEPVARSLSFISDYGATAAIACAAARMAVEVRLQPGAAPLGVRIAIDTLLSAPELRRVVTLTSYSE